MSRCYDCGSFDADPDIGLCFECFCRSRGPEEPEDPGPTTEELCDAALEAGDDSRSSSIGRN